MSSKFSSFDQKFRQIFYLKKKPVLYHFCPKRHDFSKNKGPHDYLSLTGGTDLDRFRLVNPLGSVYFILESCGLEREMVSNENLQNSIYMSYLEEFRVSLLFEIQCSSIFGTAKFRKIVNFVFSNQFLIEVTLTVHCVLSARRLQIKVLRGTELLIAKF